MRLVALALPALALAGCRAEEAGVAWHAFQDTLRGPPDAATLERTAHFEEAGIAFDYPAVLRRRDRVGEDGDREWSLEYGMFELEVAARPSGLTGGQVLSVLGEMLSGGERVQAVGPTPGRSATLCGRALTATRLRVRLLDDWSELEAFDLPAPAGESRVLSFDDEPVDGRPSALAQATWERVQRTLRCDPAFGAPAGD